SGRRVRQIVTSCSLARLESDFPLQRFGVAEYFRTKGAITLDRFDAVRIAPHHGMGNDPITPGSNVAHHERAIIRDSPFKKAKHVFATVTFGRNKIEAHMRWQDLTCGN